MNAVLAPYARLCYIRSGESMFLIKLTDFFDQNMLQLLEFKQFLFDQMSLSDGEALQVRAM
jgi:hypothetical protein